MSQKATFGNCEGFFYGLDPLSASNFSKLMLFKENVINVSIFCYNCSFFKFGFKPKLSLEAN